MDKIRKKEPRLRFDPRAQATQKSTYVSLGKWYARKKNYRKLQLHSSKYNIPVSFFIYLYAIVDLNHS